MDTVGRGIIAGFIATLVLSALVDVMTTVARSANAMHRTFVWILLFFVGSFVWGAVYALLQPLLRGPSWLRGFLFGIFAWFALMVVLMPMARAGMFGLKLGLAAPAMMLMVHLAYGVLLGVMFTALDPRRGGGHHDDDEHVSEPDDNRLHPLPR
jgi:hypothetical protein